MLLHKVPVWQCCSWDVMRTFGSEGAHLCSGCTAFRQGKKKRCPQDGATRDWNPESLMASLLEKQLLFNWSCLHILEIEHIYCISIEQHFLE